MIKKFLMIQQFLLNIEDILKKMISFVPSKKIIVKKKTQPNLLLERDPTKIVHEDGQAILLVDIENSIISQLQDKVNFIPNIYCSESACQLLKDRGVIP